MKKTLIIIAFVVAIVGALSVTVIAFANRLTKECVLSDYISEIRYDTFTYSDDNLSIKANFIEREQPLKCDGIKGEMHKTCEVEITFTTNPEKVDLAFLDKSGEMSYQSVENKYIFSCSQEKIDAKNFEITLNYTDKSDTYTLISVIDGNILTPSAALDCVREFDAATVDSLIDGNSFLGEIYVRLIFDEECFYYVGICDRSGNITAYLLNAATGRVIATKGG